VEQQLSGMSSVGLAVKHVALCAKRGGFGIPLQRSQVRSHQKVETSGINFFAHNIMGG